LPDHDSGRPASRTSGHTIAVEQPTTHHVAGHRNPSTEISLAVRRAQITKQHRSQHRLSTSRAREFDNNHLASPNNALTTDSRYR
jgi:hypothetical protein